MGTVVDDPVAVGRAAHPVTGAPDDYDALLDLVGTRRFVLIGGTRALEPLERTSVWDRGEPPETFPSGV